MSKLDDALDFLRSAANEAIVKIYTDYHALKAKIVQSSTIRIGAGADEEAAGRADMMTKITQAKDAALSSLADVRTTISDHAKTVTTETELQLGGRPDTEDVNENILREARQTAAWERIKPVPDKIPLLDISEKVNSFVTAFASEQNLDGIAGVKRELPFYIEARASDDNQADTVKTIVLDAFDRTLADGRPECQPALAAKAELLYGVSQLELAVSLCQNAITTNETSWTMPLWERRQTTVVTTTGVAGEGWQQYGNKVSQ
jgi:hypothetical protein